MEVKILYKQSLQITEQKDCFDSHHGMEGSVFLSKNALKVHTVRQKLQTYVKSKIANICTGGSVGGHCLISCDTLQITADFPPVFAQRIHRACKVCQEFRVGSRGSP